MLGPWRGRWAAKAAVLAGLALAALSVPWGGRGGASADPAPEPGTRVATFAGGCFWCMEAPFDAIDGVVSTTSGYTGGRLADPTYEQVSSGGTGHTESVQVVYDPRKVDYRRLLEVYWRNVDPLVTNRQFCDVGEQYRPEIFVHDEEQRRLAEQSKRELQPRFATPIAVRITTASRFYPAEEYHQDYYRKNPVRYRFYRYNCGRDARLEAVWGAEAGGAH